MNSYEFLWILKNSQHVHEQFFRILVKLFRILYSFLRISDVVLMNFSPIRYDLQTHQKTHKSFKMLRWDGIYWMFRHTFERPSMISQSSSVSSTQQKSPRNLRKERLCHKFYIFAWNRFTCLTLHLSFSMFPCYQVIKALLSFYVLIGY